MGAAQSFPDRGCTLNLHPPTSSHGSAVCNATAPLISYAEYPTLITANWEQCRNVCLRRQAFPDRSSQSSYISEGIGQCQSFWFQNATGLCTLSGSELYSQDLNKPGNKDTVYYSSRCFECPSACPQAAGANLFDDGDFELNDYYIGPFMQLNPYQRNNNATFGKIVQGGSNSQRSFHMPNTYQTSLYQAWNACSAMLYKLSFDYKVQCNATCDPHIVLASAEFHIEAIASKGVLVKDGSWATYNTYLYVAAPTGNSVPAIGTLEMGSTHSDPNAYDLYVDNMVMTPVTKSLIPPSTSTEFITNGGFESGMMAPWKVDPSSTSDAQASVVKPGLNRTAYAFNMTGTGSYSMDTTISKLTPGVEYVLSYDFSTTNYTSISYSFGYQGFTWNACSNFKTQAVTACQGTVRRPFIAQDATTYITFTTDFMSGSKTTLLLDNISIKKLT